MTDEEILDLLETIEELIRLGWSTEFLVDCLHEEHKTLVRAVEELRWRIDIAMVSAPQDPQWSILPPLSSSDYGVYTMPALPIVPSDEALIEDYIRSRRSIP